MAERIRNLELPAFFTYYKSPVKFVETLDGDMAAWRLNIDTGGWYSIDDLIDDIRYPRSGDTEVGRLSRDEFIQDVERDRAYYLEGEGPIFALYETVQAIVDLERTENRYLTDEELALVRGIRRKTFVMFEEKLQREGDPGADPSIAR